MNVSGNISGRYKLERNSGQAISSCRGDFARSGSSGDINLIWNFQTWENIAQIQPVNN